MSDEIKNMEMLKNMMTAEISIDGFVGYLEKTINKKLKPHHKQWLYETGLEIFKRYYYDKKIEIDLTSAEDKERLLSYLNELQQLMGQMYAHIIMLELKLHMLEEDKPQED